MTILAVAIMGIAVGCGGGGDSKSASTSTAQRLGKLAFARKASIACIEKRANSATAIQAYEKKHRSEGLPHAVLAANAYKTVLLATIEAEVVALRKLGPPAGDTGQLQTIFDHLQAAIDAARATKSISTAEIEASFVKTDEELERYGLTECTKVS